MSNILKGIINVEIPGVEATTKKAGAAVEALGSTVQKTASAVESSAQKMTVSFTPIAPAVNKTTLSLSALQKQVAAFGGGAQSFASSFVNPLKNIPPAAESASSALRKIPNASNAATLSMINLGRVVQDAPFGFLGIANNLNPLLESFQRLRQTTGTTGGALKALGSSLVGAGGIGFALSIVSSLLIVFGDRLFGAAAASKASEEALDRYGEALDDVKGKVDSLSDSLQFQNELAGLNIKINNLSDILELEGQAVSQRQLTFDLNQQLEAAQAERAKIYADEALNEEDRAKAVKDSEETIRNVRTKILQSERATSLLYRRIALQKVEDQKEANKKSEAEFERFFNKTIDQAKELETFFAKTLTPLYFDLDPQAPKADQLQKALAFIKLAIATDPVFKRVQIPVEAGIKFIARDIITDEPIKKAIETFEDVRKKFGDAVKNLPIPAIIIKTNVDVNAGIRAEEQLKKLFENLNNIIVSGITDIATAFAEGFGSALGGNNFGQEIVGVIGGLIQQIGKAMVAYGVVKTGLDKILKAGIALPGATAIGLGLAAVALGTLIKNSFKPQGRAAGGFVDAGKPYLVGEVGRELFVPNVGGRIIPNNQISQGGASFSVPRIQVVGEFIQRGKDMVATIQQVQGFQGRNA